MSDAAPALEIEVLTLFPEMLDSFLSASLLGKAIAAGLVAVHRTNPRAFARGRHKSVDDAPYGGGPGMVLRPDVLAAAIDDVEARRGRTHRVLLSPSGALLEQGRAAELVKRRRLLLVCGRYEGIDERVAALYADEALSIGDYVLSGGEVAAMVVIEALARLVPGVVGKAESTLDESFSAGRLEYPQYTRPPQLRGLAVPEVLLSGDHGAIARWRRREALRRTMARRPDLLDRHPLTDDERKLLADDE
jgi:tRNA (guanine37-N1)-methyltransferase